MTAPTWCRAWRAAAAWCLLAAVVSAAAPAQPAAADLFDEIYRHGHGFERSLRTISAGFTETTTSRLLKAPLVSTGMLAVERPGRIALHYRQPELRTILIDGDTMQVAWPSRGVHQRRDVGTARRRIDKYFVGASPAELREHFAITAAVDPASAAHWVVQLTPTRRQIRDALARIELRLARDPVALASMQLTFPNGDLKTMTFERVVTNGPIDPSLFILPR